MGNLGYAREDDDFYPTPAWCTRALLRGLAELNDHKFVSDWINVSKYPEDSVVWEPACGDGAICKELPEVGKLIATDLVYRGYGEGGIDFLESESPHPEGFVDLLVTNPPYGKLADRFVDHGMEFVKSGDVAVMAMLLRNEWDSAKSRTHLFTPDSHFLSKIVLTSRPRWFPDSTGSPRHNYSWFVWMDEAEGVPPTILYGHKD